MFNDAGGKTYYRSNNKEALNLEFYFVGRYKRIQKMGKKDHTAKKWRSLKSGRKMKLGGTYM